MIIDGLQINDWSRPVVEQVRSGGIDVVHATCGVWEDTAGAMTRIGSWRHFARQNADMVRIVTDVAGMEQAVTDDVLGIVLGFQNSSMLGDDPKMAGIFAFKEACKKAKLILLEPVMKVEVVTPDEYQGDVMGDLNRRRGKILGMETDAKQLCTVTSEVPLAEMFGYATAVRSLSRGRASYSMEPFSFEQVPGSIAEEIVSGSSKKPART